MPPVDELYVASKARAAPYGPGNPAPPPPGSPHLGKQQTKTKSSARQPVLTALIKKARKIYASSKEERPRLRSAAPHARLASMEKKAEADSDLPRRGVKMTDAPASATVSELLRRGVKTTDATASATVGALPSAIGRWVPMNASAQLAVPHPFAGTLRDDAARDHLDARRMTTRTRTGTRTRAAAGNVQIHQSPSASSVSAIPTSRRPPIPFATIPSTSLQTTRL